MGGLERPLLSHINPKRIIVITFSSLEIDHLVSAFLSERSRPESIGDDDIDVRRHPWLPGWRSLDGGEPRLLPRVTISILRRARDDRRRWVRARIELWCLQDLTAGEGDDVEVVRRIVERGARPDLLLSCSMSKVTDDGPPRVIVSQSGTLDELPSVVEGVRLEVESRSLGCAVRAVSGVAASSRLGLPDLGGELPTIAVTALVGASAQGPETRYGRELVAAHDASITTAWLVPALVDALFLGLAPRVGTSLMAASAGSGG